MVEASKSWDPRLGPILEELLHRLRDGETDAVEQACLTTPELAAKIKECADVILSVEGCNSSVTAGPQALGEYILLAELGRGGMGIVYRAYQPKLDRFVALKTLPFSGTADETLLARFQLEAKAVARLKHQNIVGVYDVGKADGQHYLSMQLIEGVSLSRILHELRKLPGLPTTQEFNKVFVELAAELYWPADGLENEVSENRTDGGQGSEEQPQNSNLAFAGFAGKQFRYIDWCTSVAQQVAQALDYAHRSGVVHRDVKPSNILVDQRGQVWVADFGLAKIDESSFTNTGDVVGTLRYLAPERLQGWSDSRSDIFSLGLTLFEMLTLRTPYEGDEAAALMAAVHRADIPSVGKLQPKVSRDLQTVVSRSVAPLPEKRYPSALDFADDLERVLAGRPVLAKRSSAPERLWMWCRRNPVIAGLLTASLLMLVAVAVVSTWSAQLLRYRLVKVREANTLADQRLLESYWTQLESITKQQALGNRRQALDTIEAALPLVEEIQPEQTSRLRNLAIRASTLFDASVEASVNLQDRAAPSDLQQFGMDSRQIDFDADVKQIAVVTAEGLLEIVDIESGAFRKIWQLPARPRYCSVTLSPNGKFAMISGAVGPNGIAYLIRLADSKVLFSHTSENGSGQRPGFSADSRRVALLMGYGHVKVELLVLDVDTGIPLLQNRLGQQICYGSDLSCTGEFVLLAKRTGVEVIDVSTGELLHEINSFVGGQQAVFGRNDSSVLIHKPGGRLEIWCLHGGKYQLKHVLNSAMPTAADSLHALDNLPYATAFSEREIAGVWDMHAQKELLLTNFIRCTVSANGARIGFFDAEKNAGAMRFEAPQSFRRFLRRGTYRGTSQIEESRDGNKLIARGHGSCAITVFDPNSRSILAQILSDYSDCMGIEPAPDESAAFLVTLDGEPELRIKLLRLVENREPVAEFGRQIKLDDVAMRGFNQNATSRCFLLNDGNVAILSSNSLIWCDRRQDDAGRWEIKTDSVSPLPFVHGDAQYAAATGLFAVGSFNSGGLVVYDVETREPVFQFPSAALEQRRPVESDVAAGTFCCFSPQGDQLAVQTASACYVFETASWGLIAELAKKECAFGGMAMSDTWFAVGCGSEIELYDRADYRYMASLSSCDSSAQYSAPSAYAAPGFLLSKHNGKLYAGTVGPLITEWDLDNLNRELEAIGLGW